METTVPATKHARAYGDAKNAKNASYERHNLLFPSKSRL